MRRPGVDQRPQVTVGSPALKFLGSDPNVADEVEVGAPAIRNATLGSDPLLRANPISKIRTHRIS